MSTATRSKILRWLVVAVLVLAVALPALAGWSKWCSTSGTCVINPTGTWSCASGQEWRLRTVTSGFGPLDSTGNGTFTLTSGGYDYHKYRTGEWDGYTWTWWSGRSSMTYASVFIGSVAGSADNTFSVTCAKRP